MNVVAAFDSSAGVVGTTINDTEAYHSDDLEKMIEEHSIDVAHFSCLQKRDSRWLNDPLRPASKGILNLHRSGWMLVMKSIKYNIDLSVELQALFFYMKNF